MKKITFILLLLALIGIQCLAQINYAIFNLDQTHSQFKNLNGKVKVLKEYRYKNTSPESGDKLDEPGKLEMHFITEYNLAGNMTIYTQYRLDGSIAKQKNYSYDKQGRLSQVIDNTPDSKNSPSYRTIITYDGLGKMTGETSSSFSGAVSVVTTFSYSAGRLASYEIVYPYDGERWTHSLQYNAKGQVVRFEAKRKISHNISLRKLDDKTSLLMQEIDFEDGAKTRTTDYAYDPWGNMVSQQYDYQLQGSHSGREQHRYEYDGRQNWVSKRSDFYQADGYHSQAVARREIAYY